MNAEWSFLFFLNSALFGVGLAMDAFSVSLANGLHDPQMARSGRIRIAGTFAIFQILMPLAGWFCVRRIAQLFLQVRPLIPWIALILLLYIGKMLLEGLRGDDGDEEEGQCSASALSTRDLLIQGIATSIDALSVGFTIEELPVSMALTESLIIGLVTFGICLAGIQIGSRAGTKLKGKASMLGGVILILIGVEICLKGVL